jgi:hypothetical protein
MAGRHEGKDGQGGTWTLVLFNFHIPPCPSIPSSLPVIPFLHPSIHFLSFFMQNKECMQNKSTAKDIKKTHICVLRTDHKTSSQTHLSTKHRSAAQRFVLIGFL